MTKNFKLTKYACYYANLSMASVFCLPPLLFGTFREMYGISYTLLGTLVLINFCTQLSIDLVFTFFSRFFNIKLAMRTMPLITALGLLIYALSPFIFPNNIYIGFVIGTVVFSVSAGLAEVLISPVVAALPSKNPDRDMSALHSLYAYGLVIVIVLSTLFINFFGKENWIYLTLFWASLPVISSILLFVSPMPDMHIEDGKSSKNSRKRIIGTALCFACIFLGGAAECTMTSWISVYIKKALNIPKIWGDIGGMALFALLIGLTRSLYAKNGKNISRVLLCGMFGATICYLIVAFSNSAPITLIACVSVGMFTAMLWPGTLIFMEEQFPAIGVAAYALLAAGGDSGASVAPQLVGLIVDKVSLSNWAIILSERLSLSVEQIGLKAGMFVAALFPLVGIFVLIYTKKFFANKEDKYSFNTAK